MFNKNNSDILSCCSILDYDTNVYLYHNQQKFRVDVIDINNLNVLIQHKNIDSEVSRARRNVNI